ncbi:LAME_0H01046g1_1 [Lachancea meyersii CBS 8951]|uniref:rRNA-processing protein EFG1 n=1 Tax=Lachancea meyersii CBS 8951 TaxID=1266667 RepID=A0A1G4KD61_9SACH|nr:LAME_0H01046g1_1 [Lachancea meyersii CBS 8951]
MDRKQQRRSNKPLGNSVQLAHVLGSGSNKIKKKIRDIERLLQKKKDVLPDTILIEKERSLEALRFELKNAELRVKVQQNAKKYHMVRFFERKKALRRYKQAVKTNNKKEIRARAVDLCYVVNFPKTEKYIALYPTSEDGKDTEEPELSEEKNDKTTARRSAYHKLIAASMDSGELPVSLPDILKGAKLDRDGNGIQLAETGKPSSKENTKQESGSGVQEEEDEDDFFES